MLHATELVARQHDKAIVLKRVWYARVLLHPAQRQGYLIEHDGQLCHLGSIGLAIKARQQSAVKNSMLYLELSRREREQIGGNGLPCLIADAHPPLRNIQFQVKNRLQVRLVETREHAASMIRHKQGIHVVIAAVQRLVAAITTNGYRVLALYERLGRDDDMLVKQDGLDGFAIDHQLIV